MAAFRTRFHVLSRGSPARVLAHQTPRTNSTAMASERAAKQAVGRVEGSGIAGSLRREEAYRLRTGEQVETRELMLLR